MNESTNETTMKTNNPQTRLLELGLRCAVHELTSDQTEASERIAEALAATLAKIEAGKRLSKRDRAYCRATMPAARRMIEAYLGGANRTNDRSARLAVETWLLSHDLEENSTTTKQPT